MRSRPVTIFVSSAAEDDDASRRLERHLTALQRSGRIEIAHRGSVHAGADLRRTLNEHIDRADIVVLLLSSDFLAEDDCAVDDVQRALMCASTRVVPVLLRDCDFRGQSFGTLHTLPKDGRPILSWEITDEAFAEVARALREVVEEVESSRGPTSSGIAATERAVSRPQMIRLVLQWLRDPNCSGVAMLEPLGFRAHEVSGEVRHLLQQPAESLYPVRLVPELRAGSEAQLYARLLRDLRRELPETWRFAVDSVAASTEAERFELAVEALLDGPVQRENRQLVILIDGLAKVPVSQAERWGFLMARLSGLGLKLLIWGGAELDELRNRPPTDGHFSAFHHLREVRVGPLSKDEIEARILSAHGDGAPTAAVHHVTGGHPALVEELLRSHAEEVRAGDAGAITARVVYSRHMERLSRELESEKAVQSALNEVALHDPAPLPRVRRPEEDRLFWLGILKESGPNGWDWTAPVMRQLAGQKR